MVRSASWLAAFGVVAYGVSSTGCGSSGKGVSGSGTDGGNTDASVSDSSSGDASSGGPDSAAEAAGSCVRCVSDGDCGGGVCAELGGATYCAGLCGDAGACAVGESCVSVSTSADASAQACVPIAPCESGGSGADSGSDASMPVEGTDSGSGAEAGVDSGSVGDAGHAAEGGDAGVDAGGSPDSGSVVAADAGTFGAGGGTLASLNFAILGDTRPPTQDDTSGYPTATITSIFDAIEASSPHPAFAISTGDYMFALPTRTPGTQSTQLGYYMSARAKFSGVVFPAMGNQECDGATQDNCYDCGVACNGVGGICDPTEMVCKTPNLSAFLSTLLAPIGQTQPYYTINVNGTNNAWTAKFVFVACNAWSSTQATWLDTQLSTPTTYTFVVRHEGTDATTAPCLTTTAGISGTADTILAQHPYTLLIAGHTHTYAYYVNQKEVIVGNGGAPLAGSPTYGYVIGQQQANGSIAFTSYTLAAAPNNVAGQFVVQ